MPSIPARLATLSNSPADLKSCTPRKRCGAHSSSVRQSNTLAHRERRAMEMALIEARIRRDNASYFTSITGHDRDRCAVWRERHVQALKDIEAIEAKLKE